MVLHSTFFFFLPRDGAENGGSRDGLRHHFPYVFDFKNAEIFFFFWLHVLYPLLSFWGKKNKEGKAVTDGTPFHHRIKKKKKNRK